MTKCKVKGIKLLPSKTDSLALLSFSWTGEEAFAQEELMVPKKTQKLSASSMDSFNYG
jgi:hypothetical protein